MLVVSLLPSLLISWTVITTILAGLLIYRSLIGMKEDDQLFLDPAESQLEAEQRAILTLLTRLAPFVKGFALASSALLVLIAGAWIYRGVAGIAGPRWRRDVSAIGRATLPSFVGDCRSAA